MDDIDTTKGGAANLLSAASSMLFWWESLMTLNLDGFTNGFSAFTGASIRRIVIACIASLCTISSAQTPRAPTIVMMRSFNFEPAQIELRTGVPVLLRLENQSSVGHSFVAPGFFATAHIDTGSARFINRGSVEVPPHQAVDLILVPAAGAYPLKCGHPFHALFGMRGMVVVR